MVTFVSVQYEKQEQSEKTKIQTSVGPSDCC